MRLCSSQISTRGTMPYMSHLKLWKRSQDSRCCKRCFLWHSKILKSIFFGSAASSFLEKLQPKICTNTSQETNSNSIKNITRNIQRLNKAGVGPWSSNAGRVAASTVPCCCFNSSTEAEECASSKRCTSTVKQKVHFDCWSYVHILVWSPL